VEALLARAAHVGPRNGGGGGGERGRRGEQAHEDYDCSKRVSQHPTPPHTPCGAPEERNLGSNAPLRCGCSAVVEERALGEVQRSVPAVEVDRA